MMNGNIKIASMEARLIALELAKQNKRNFLQQHKEIPEYMYDELPQTGKGRKLKLIKKIKF